MSRPPGNKLSVTLMALALVATSALCREANARPAPVTAPAGPGQPALAVGWFEPAGLRASVCPGAPCDANTGRPIALPEQIAALAEGARFEVLKLGPGRHAVHAVIPDPEHKRAYEVLVAAPLTGAEPLLLFEGFTGLVSGQYGAREGPMLYVSEASRSGERRVVVGKQYEAISLCGRPSVLAPALLNPRDLKLYPAKVQRLPPSERNKAKRLQATRREQGAKLGPPVLRAVGASSGIGAPQNLTDADLSSSWAENRGGEGRGEFVTFNAPPQLAIAGFDLSVRPSGDAPPEHGASPREFWLVTGADLVHVSLPEDAWQQPGAVYRVMLETPINTDCVALVIETGFGDKDDMQVTLSEVTAVSEFDAEDLPGLVGALAGGGQRAEAAKTVLMSGGEPAFRAVASAYSSLDEGGRRVALDVMDQASCELATPTYVRALLSRYKAHAIHAKDRLRRCGRKSAEHLALTLRIARPRARPILAGELGLVAPDRAIIEIAPLLDDDAVTRRRLLRITLARATLDTGTEQAVEQVLGDAALPARARLEVLRALGPSASRYGSAATRAFANLLRAADFRTRYLLLEPAAALSAIDQSAQQYLSRTLSSDSNQHLRFGAALAAREVGPLTPELINATRDRAVRVRKAAVDALAQRRADQAAAALGERLAEDRWPLVRGAAAEALGGLGASAAVDEALGRALDDASPSVRAPVALALGQRGARGFAPALRDRLEDDKEDAGVRRATAQALGRLCDHEALDTLTELGQKRADPLLDQAGRSLSMAALEALAALGPTDLRERLKPLFSRQAAPGSREAAERVLGSRPSCPRR